MSDDIDPVRRRLVLGGLTAGTAIAAPDASADEAPPPPASPRALKFETTDHVRAYYRRARG